MRFQNTAPHDLKFEIDGVTYEVTVGGSCEIPGRIAYAIASRGLPMKPAAEIEPVKVAMHEEMTEAELDAATAPVKPRRGRDGR